MDQLLEFRGCVIRKWIKREDEIEMYTRIGTKMIHGDQNSEGIFKHLNPVEWTLRKSRPAQALLDLLHTDFVSRKSGKLTKRQGHCQPSTVATYSYLLFWLTSGENDFANCQMFSSDLQM